MISLTLIGTADSLLVIIFGICLFSFCMRILNIAMNTQSLTLQKSFEKKIIGSFHGVWSTGGLAGVGFSTLMIKLDQSLEIHLMMVSLFLLLISFFVYRFLIKRIGQFKAIN